MLLWFASWKNGLSSYPPGWVKKDFERFPRAQIVGGGTWPVLTRSGSRASSHGEPSIELLSPFSDANRDADARAFAALMRHIKEMDGREHTVIMIQVENEVGMQGDTRDRSPAANQAFAGPVPKELMDYLQQHKDTLIPEFRKVWEAAGFKTSGTWEEVFGKGRRRKRSSWPGTLRATSAGWPRRVRPNTRSRCSPTARVRNWEADPQPVKGDKRRPHARR